MNLPCGGVKLKGEDGVISVAYLANEAPLSAQVAVKHVVGSVVQQCDQVGCIVAFCYLEIKRALCWKQKYTDK